MFLINCGVKDLNVHKMWLIVVELLDNDGKTVKRDNQCNGRRVKLRGNRPNWSTLASGCKGSAYDYSEGMQLPNFTKSLEGETP